MAGSPFEGGRISRLKSICGYLFQLHAFRRDRTVDLRLQRHQNIHAVTPTRGVHSGVSFINGVSSKFLETPPLNAILWIKCDLNRISIKPF